MFMKQATCIHAFHIVNGNTSEYLNGMFQFAVISHYYIMSGKE